MVKGRIAILVRIGSVSRSFTKDRYFYVVSYLPNISVAQGMNHFTTDADARTIFETVAQKWFDRIEPAITIARKPMKSED